MLPSSTRAPSTDVNIVATLCVIGLLVLGNILFFQIEPLYSLVSGQRRFLVNIKSDLEQCTDHLLHQLNKFHQDDKCAFSMALLLNGVNGVEEDSQNQACALVRDDPVLQHILFVRMEQWIALNHPIVEPVPSTSNYMYQSMGERSVVLGCEDRENKKRWKEVRVSHGLGIRQFFYATDLLARCIQHAVDEMEMFHLVAKSEIKVAACSKESAS